MKKELPLNISSRIKYYRSLLRLPQTFVAERLNVARTTYTKMESGSLEFSANNLQTLANLFKVKIENFFEPLRIDLSGVATLKDRAQFRLTDSDFRFQDSECLMEIVQGANDLIIWSQEPKNKDEQKGRQQRAKSTYSKFKNLNDAVEYCRSISAKYEMGNAIDVFSMAMEHFGLWISWNSYGVFSGVYVKADTEITDGLKIPLPLVGINSDHPSERQRFSGAHELGHHLLGQRGPIGSPTKPVTDLDEKEANQFAADLLMEPSKVIGLLKEMMDIHKSKLDLPSIVLLEANLLQVSYAALTRKLISLGAIPFEKQNDLLQAKVRVLEQGLMKAQKLQPFQNEIISKCENKLKKEMSFYKFDKKSGAPSGPADIRFLQDYCYVEYLQACKTKSPLDSSVIFQEVVKDVTGRYPTYVNVA